MSCFVQRGESGRRDKLELSDSSGEVNILLTSSEKNPLIEKVDFIKALGISGSCLSVTQNS